MPTECSSCSDGCCAHCITTIPSEQNVQVYIDELNRIINSYKTNPDKDILLEKINTLYALLAAVRSKST